MDHEWLIVIIRRPESDSDFEGARMLFREYQASLDVDLGFQGIAEEIASLPGKYAAPLGALFLAWGSGERPMGCAAVRPLERSGACEVKRLYVRPCGRGAGAGRALVGRALAFARAAGYREILLDSLPSMERAIDLYRSLGFREVEPYGNETLPGTLCFRLQLRPR